MTTTAWISILVPIVAASITALVAHFHFVSKRNEVGRWHKINLQLEVIDRLSERDPERAVLQQYVTVMLRASIASDTRTTVGRFLAFYITAGFLAIGGSALGIVASLQGSLHIGQIAWWMFAVGFVGLLLSMFVRVHRWAPPGAPAPQFNAEMQNLHRVVKGLYPPEARKSQSSLGLDLVSSIAESRRVNQDEAQRVGNPDLN